jgi:uncharacterized membrane protein/ribosomal protein L40E
MSLESARKLGLTASLIQVVMPVILVILLVAVFLVQFARFPATSGSTLFASVFTSATVVLLSIIGLVGIILFLIAMKRLARYYNEPGIFKNVLYAFLLTILGGVSLYIVQFAFLSNVTGSMTSGSTTGVNAPLFAQLIFTLLAIFVIAFILAIISAVLYWRSFNKLAEKSGIEHFKTAGMLYLIGTVLSIVGIGVFLVWIAWILNVLAFNALKAPIVTAPSAFQSAPNIGANKYCQYCGAENYPDAVFCKNCGKQIQWV